MYLDKNDDGDKRRCIKDKMYTNHDWLFRLSFIEL